MTRKEFREQVEYYAQCEREAGGKVEINSMYMLPYVAINMSDGTEYFFQEHEATELLEEIPEDIEDEDFLLWLAQRW